MALPGGTYYNPDQAVYQAWNRIEARPRTRQFERVLKTEIHDPLWMLGRQWQMGEFTGNDTGSGILARLQMDYNRISGISAYGGTASTYNPDDMPLEPLIERLNYQWSIKERILLGRKLLQFIKKNIPSGFTHYHTEFSNAFPLDRTPPNTSNSNEILEKGNVFCDTTVTNFHAGIAIVNLIIDGGKIFDEINVMANSAALTHVVVAGVDLNGPDTNAMLTTLGEFVLWVRRMYTLPGTNLSENWNKKKLAYQFQAYCAKDASNNSKLLIKDHHQGHLDWYSFVEDTTVSGGAAKEEKVLQIIMSEARFAGMPASRWWEFENGGVNFCKIDGNTTDIAKIIMTQFALVFQDDWFVVPYKVPVGSYASVNGIVVTDVFNVRTFIKSYNTTYSANAFQSNGDDSWKKWRWMDIGHNTAIVGNTKPTGKLLIPPVSVRAMESKPFESVVCIRDEMANMVWAIEKTVPDLLGKGTDGFNKANNYLNYLKTIKPATSGPYVPADPNAKLKYQLINTEIPENWIPFIPVHAAASTVKNRAVDLQRAAMPRLLDPYPTTLVRPRTGILNYGVTNNGAVPYYINEEEVPRSGCVIETSFQRTRWYNGKIVAWVGRRKTTGRGQGASGLAFDTVTSLES